MTIPHVIIYRGKRVRQGSRGSMASIIQIGHFLCRNYGDWALRLRASLLISHFLPTALSQLSHLPWPRQPINQTVSFCCCCLCCRWETAWRAQVFLCGETIQSHGYLWTAEGNAPFCFGFRLQDCRRGQFGSLHSAAVGDRPQLCRSLSSGQDQHGVDPAQAAGPADPHGEPQLHPAGSPAGTRGPREDASLWRLQQNHPVRLPQYICA